MAVIPSFGVLDSRNRKVRITELEPVVALDFQAISNRGRKLAPDAIEFAAFLKTYIAPSERAVAKKGEGSPLPLRRFTPVPVFAVRPAAPAAVDLLDYKLPTTRDFRQGLSMLSQISASSDLYNLAPFWLR